jgi:predicted nucleic acid-binding protein
VKRILFDTNAYAAFKRGDPGAAEVVRLADRIGMNAVVLGELLAGFAGGSHEERNRRELAEFLASPRVTAPLPIGTAEHYRGLSVTAPKGRLLRTISGSRRPRSSTGTPSTRDEHFQAIGAS